MRKRLAADHKLSFARVFATSREIIAFRSEAVLFSFIRIGLLNYTKSVLLLSVRVWLQKNVLESTHLNCKEPI